MHKADSILAQLEVQHAVCVYDKKKQWHFDKHQVPSTTNTNTSSNNDNDDVYYKNASLQNHHPNKTKTTNRSSYKQPQQQHL